MISDEHLERLKSQAIKDWKKTRALEEEVKLLNHKNKWLEEIINSTNQVEISKGVLKCLTTGSQGKPTHIKNT